MNNKSHAVSTGALEATVGEAIALSIRENRSVTLTPGGRDCPYSAEQLADVLERECENSVPDVGDYWGTDCDGATWRVHLFGDGVEVQS